MTIVCFTCHVLSFTRYFIIKSRGGEHFLYIIIKKGGLKMNAFKINRFSIALADFTQSAEFVLLAVTPVFLYKDAVKTDEVIGQKYQVADPLTFEAFEIRVDHVTPIVTQSEIEHADDRFFVTFENALLKPFKIEYGKIVCTITADSVKLVN